MYAQAKLEAEQPDRVITIGGNCMVSLAPFDYLHGRYENTGIIWIDAHPDVSTVNDGYPCAHAMVLGSLLGYGAEQLSGQMKHAKFKPEEILYVGRYSRRRLISLPAVIFYSSLRETNISCQ